MQGDTTAVTMGLCPERGGTQPFVELIAESGWSAHTVAEDKLHHGYRSERFFLLHLDRAAPGSGTSTSAGST